VFVVVKINFYFRYSPSRLSACLHALAIFDKYFDENAKYFRQLRLVIESWSIVCIIAPVLSFYEDYEIEGDVQSEQ